jgi:hypothetical protein
MIIGIHEYNRYIYKYPYPFIQFEDSMNGLEEIAYEH